MKKILWIFPVLLVWAFSACKHPDNRLFDRHRIGQLTRSVPPDSLADYFPGDSIAKPRKVTGLKTQQVVEVYDTRTHNLLLRLHYAGEGDSLKLSSAEILSPLYHTADGLSLDRDFGRWKARYTPGNVETTLRHVVVFVPQLDATLVFDQSDLAETARNNPLVKPGPEAIKPGAHPRSVLLFFR